MNWKRPLGLLPLLSVLLTLVVLTAMLSTMVWSRISLLQNGTEIILKTAPIDPRDLLRGYFVRLRYDISTISVDELEEPMSQDEFGEGFKRRSQVFVKLQPDKDGYWAPVSLHKTRPEPQSGPLKKHQTVFIRGRVRYGSCNARMRKMIGCKVFIRYGIEKFFAEKARAKKLEDFGRATSSEQKELTRQIDQLQKKRQRLITEQRNQSNETEKRAILRDYMERPEIKQLTEKLADLRRRQGVLREQDRKEMAKRFAVIARIDKQSGEAAISGLQLDGQRIYDERLF